MNTFFFFFFLSGFCAMVYQVVWLRVAMAGFGVTTTLISIVLSIFMAGLAIGSWAGGRVARRLEKSPPSLLVFLYGATELIIGISGFVVAPLLHVGKALLSGQEGPWGSLAHYVASAAWIGVVLLPFCTCMGATFPFAMAGIRSAFRDRSSTSFSYLYVANVLGAVAGTLGSAFVFIETLGFSRTLLIAAVANGIIAVGSVLMALGMRNTVGAQPATASASAGADSVHKTGASLPASPISLPLLFTSGLASLGMEVVWTRQFMPIVGPVVYSFAAILAVYLGATVIGSRVYRAWADRFGEHLAVAGTAILAGGCALLPLLATDPRLPSHSFLSRAVLVICGIAPFCAITGFMTPMLIDRFSHGDPDRAGRAYAVNAFGCIIGPLLAGFVLLPFIGERWSLLVLGLPFFGFGMWALRSDTATARFRPAVSAILGATAVASLLLLTLTRDFETIFPESLVRRDYTATSIAAGQGMDRVLLINGVGITRLSPVTKVMVHLPLASLSSPPKSVLVLCFGMGTSFRSALSWGVPVTVAELVPSVPSLFSYFHADGDELMKSPNAKVVIDDARRFLERTRESFDVIVIDPPPPVEAAGSSLLYSTEFYEVARRHLRPGGILQQWLPAGDATVKSSFAQSLRHDFPHLRVFESVEGWGYHFLASESPLPNLSPATLAAHMPPAAARDLVEWGPASEPSSQFEKVLEGERQVEDLIEGAPSAPLLTDDRPVNEYYLLRRMKHGEPRNTEAQSSISPSSAN